MDKKLTGYPSLDKPWLQYYSKESMHASLPDCTMYEYIRDCNKDNGNRVAMNYYGANITYAQMFEKIDYMASALEAAGIQKGEAVTVCMLNAPETVCLLFALNKIGAVANMVYGVDPPDELQKHLLDANSRFVFTLDMFQEKFVSIADNAKLKKLLLSILQNPCHSSIGWERVC